MPASPSPATSSAGPERPGGAQTAGGASEIAYILALKYVTGPLTVGIQAEEAWYQGDVALTGLSQRRARGITFGGTYTVAPGFIAFAEYLWQDRSRPASTSSVAGEASLRPAADCSTTTPRAQGFLIGNVINF